MGKFYYYFLVVTIKILNKRESIWKVISLSGKIINRKINKMRYLYKRLKKYSKLCRYKNI